MHYDSERISYLDLWIIKEGDQLYTDLYTKPTDSNTLLKADSYHPLHLKNSLPFSQLCRVKRICTRENDFDRNAEMMLNKFRTRGYKENTLTTAKSKIDKTNRDEFLKTSPKKSNNSIVFTTKYTKSAEKYKGIVLKHWHILTSDKKISHLYKEPPKVVFKRGRNLGDIITASDLIPTPTASQTLLTPIPDGNYKCGACAQCNSTAKSKYFRHPHSGKKIPVRGIISCATTRVVYYIYCCCGLGYVGQTKRQLKQRIAEHRSAIRRQDMSSPIAAHFIEAGHSISSLRYTGIEHVSLSRRGGDLERQLLRREAYWMYFLNTRAPFGLNIDYDLRPFL